MLEKLPKLKNSILDKMSQWQTEREHHGAYEGIKGA